MKILKWVTIITLLATFMSMFAGCGAKEEAQAPSAEEKPQEEKPWTGKITIWDGPRWPDDQQNKFFWLEAKKAEFEQSHPGVEIEIAQVPWEELPNKLNVSIAGRNWPDIAPIDMSGFLSLDQIQQGVIESVDEIYTAEEWEDFYPNAINAYQYEGKIYGVPNSVTVHSLLLNLDIFKERGVEPPKDGVWTYDEFVEKMKQLTFDRDGDGKIDVYGFSTYVLPGYYESWPFLYMDGGQPLSEDMTEYTFDDAKVISGLQKLSDLEFVHKAAPQEMGGTDIGGVWKAWAASDQRTVAVEPWATWAISTARGEKYKTNFMVAAYPTGDLGHPVTIGGVGGWVMYHQEDAAKKKVVAEFIKHLASTDEQFEMAKNYGVFPARKSASDKNPFEGNEQMVQAMKLTENAIMLPRHRDWKKIDEAIQGQLQLVLNGEKSAEQGLKDARSFVEEIIK